MSPVTHRCTCGATLRYRQDLRCERGGTSRTWKCKECGSRVPGRIGEQLGHQHPS